MVIIHKHITTVHDRTFSEAMLVFFRTCFTMIALSYLPVWLTLDYVSDLMYMIDMIITLHTGNSVGLQWEFKFQLTFVTCKFYITLYHIKYDSLFSLAASIHVAAVAMAIAIMRKSHLDAF